MATIYITGTTTLASIASDSSGTPKSNPFTADSDGYISFYALDGVYDVKMSGGGLLTPITRSGFWIVTSSGGGGGGITGSGTTGRFPIFTSSSAIGNSVFQQVGTSEFAPAATGKRINLGTESQQVVEIANAAVGGTVQNRLAILTGAPSTAITAAITDTSKIVGIVIANAGTSGNAQIVQNGSVDCEFDGATTAGNYVGASTTLAGRCKDLGSSLPTTGVQVIGRVLETIGSAGNALVYTFTGEQHTSGLGGSGTTNYMSYWTSASTLAASNLLYDISGQILQSGYSFDIQNGGLSELTLETDQVIIKGGVNRATSAHVVQVKGVASQSGDYFRAIDSTSSTKFRIRSTGQPSFGGVNYTFPSLPATTSCLQISSAGVISTVACTTGGVRQAINVMQAPYSCVGDGVTDDTACFQAALDAGEASDGKLVYAPTATYKVTGLTVAGGTMLEGDGREKTIIYGYTDVPVLDLTPGTGVFLYRGPTVRSLTVKGSNSGSNQIGIKVDSTPYMEEAEVSDVIVRDTGSHGVYFGNVFSSTFKRIYASATTSGYPFLFNQFNMPGNTYEGLYAQDVNSGSPAGFRIRTGDIHCWGCNGINNSSSNSWWATVGDKIGVDGATSNISAYFNCWGCNIESSKAGGIQHYSDSTSNLDGRTIFAGDSSGSGTYIALKYEVTTPGSGGLPAAQPKGNLGPLVVFANSPLAYYANSEVIHANDLPPVTIEGDVRQADGAIISSYRNTTNSRSEKVFRLDARMPVTTITASASYTQPGATNYEANCAAPCTLTLPWPGYWASMEQFIYIRNIGAGALTLAANSGGSFNGGAGPVLAQYESVTYIAHSASADYRQVGFAGAGVSNRIPYFSDVQRLASSSNFTYDGTTVLNQKAGGNPYFAANDTTNSITTRFGPLAGAPDRAIIGTTSNHPFGLYANNGERWTIGTTGHLTPGAATSYNIGSASLPINDLTIGGKLYWTGSTVFDFSGSGTPEGSITASIGSVYRRTNGSTGTTLYIKESGSGNTGWAPVVSGTPSLTATYVGYGNGSNVLTGTSDLAYNTSTKTLTVTNGSGASSIFLTGTSDTSKVNFGSGSVPGNQGGIVFPFVGGGITTGPGIWWCSSASYASCSGLFISNGLTYQGTNSTHDHFKIAVGTGTSSSGANVWDFAPTSSLLTQTMSTSATGTAHVGNAITLTSTGTAAANFGYSQTFTLENGSGSNVAATAIAHTWSVATAGAETGRVAISTNLAGAGVGEAFVVEGSQYYGTLYSKGNISGAVTIDFANGNVVTATLTGNVTSLAFSNIKTGGIYYLHFIQDALGPWTLTVPAALKVNGGYVISAGVNKRDLLICSATSTSQLYCSKAQDQQ